MFTPTDAWIIGYCLALGICVFIFIFQFLSIFYNSSRLDSEGRQGRASKEGSVSRVLSPLFATYILSIAGISSAIHRLHDAEQSLCDYTYALSFACYGSIKICNYFFFLQRAKLAQGMQPIFRDHVFDVTLPIVLVLIWIVYLLWISFHPLTGLAVTSSRTGRKLCIWVRPDTLQYIGVVVQSVLDISWTIFFLYLFGKPMIEIQKRSALSHKKRKKTQKSLADKKLDRTIMINFVSSAICSLHTTICALTFPLGIGFFSWWSIFDYAVSSMCLFSMLASNRRFLVHMICCSRKCAECCIKPATFLTREEITSRVESSQLGTDKVNTSNMNLRAPSFVPPIASKSSANSSPPPPISEGGDPADDFYDIRFCGDICCGSSHKSRWSLTEWMTYLDANCCYYKSKLLWTWLYYSFCCCHCYAIPLYLSPHNVLKDSANKKKKEIMNAMFASAEKLVTQKFYFGMDLEVQNTQESKLRSRVRSGSSHIKVVSATVDLPTPEVSPPPPSTITPDVSAPPTPIGMEQLDANHFDLNENGHSNIDNAISVMSIELQQSE